MNGTLGVVIALTLLPMTMNAEEVVKRDNPAPPKCEGTYRNAKDKAEEVLSVACAQVVPVKCKCEKTQVSCSEGPGGRAKADDGFEYIYGTCRSP